MYKNIIVCLLNNLHTKLENQSNVNYSKSEITKEKIHSKNVKVLDTAQKHYAT